MGAVCSVWVAPTSPLPGICNMIHACQFLQNSDRWQQEIWWDHPVANQFQRLELCLKHIFPYDNLYDFLDHEITCSPVNKLINFITPTLLLVFA